MTLADADYELVVDHLHRKPTPVEEALFENLWSEHCAYRSSRPLLKAFDSEGEQVVVGPGDDAAVVALPVEDTGDEADEIYITMGIESHNHPSYVDPFDGAATGVGGIVRDTLSMGAYPIALADSLYFGPFDREHSRYLFEGVVEGISHYGNCIGVPTVAGSVAFHEDYIGNPLVNVACIGLIEDPERMVTAVAQQPGNKLVLVGNGTGRDGLGGASFASEDLAEDAQTEDRPAVQVGDPYTEKLLIETNEQLLEDGLVESARDLGAAGLGGATSEMVAKGDLGARIDLERVHQREPNMNALEILLSESQERMCYEVRPEDVEAVRAIASQFDLESSVVGEVTDGNYVCTFEEETVVDVDAKFLGDGAPANELETAEPTSPKQDIPEVDPSEAIDAILARPNTASKRWVYRQYDHEVQVRTAIPPGDDAALLAIRSAGLGLAFSAGADPNWTTCDPYQGARAVALENATNVAAKGATPLAAVDCLNGGNPEKPAVYGGFAGIVDGLADMCATLDIPIVGGNVSLYNDSPAGPIPPTPTLALVGTKPGYSAPPISFAGEGELLLIGEGNPRETQALALGGSEFLAHYGGADQFPQIPDDPTEWIETLVRVARYDSTLATHDVSHGGIAVTLAEMVTRSTGATVDLERGYDDPSGTDLVRLLFSERPGRVVIETTDPERVRSAFDGVTPVTALGSANKSGRLDLAVGTTTIGRDIEEIRRARRTIERALE